MVAPKRALIACICFAFLIVGVFQLSLNPDEDAIIVVPEELIHPEDALYKQLPRAVKLVQNAEKIETLHVCFVIRTYWAHGEQGSNDLPRLLTQLVSSNITSWQVLLLVMDKRPFTDLDSIVQRLEDDRITVFETRYSEQYNPKQPDGSWSTNYHDLLYKMTDDAIYQGCSSNTRWLAVTNGDNQYDRNFLPLLLSVPKNSELIAFDYYSRYQRPTAPPCERFASGPSLPPCKENELRFCNTDLTANVYDYAKFVAEKRGFGKVESFVLGLNDGLLAQQLVDAGWKVHHLHDLCPVEHSPSPQLCALEGLIWDDGHYNSYSQSGGRCIDTITAASHLSQNPHLELVAVNVSHDGVSFGVRGLDNLTLQCIRDPNAMQNGPFFPEQCVAKIDGGHA